jgi:hypothetical protein
MALLSLSVVRTKSAKKSKTPQAQARWGFVIRPGAGTWTGG